jgi:hypothetical protein
MWCLQSSLGRSLLLYQGTTQWVPHSGCARLLGATRVGIPNLNRPLLYQGTSLLVPQSAQNQMGFSPGVRALDRVEASISLKGLQNQDSR